MRDLTVSYLREDELEALRLCDLEGMDQETAGERMGVSRGTVQRLLKSGRETLLRVLVENQALVIGRGPSADQGIEGWESAPLPSSRGEISRST